MLLLQTFLTSAINDSYQGEKNRWLLVSTLTHSIPKSNLNSFIIRYTWHKTKSLQCPKLTGLRISLSYLRKHFNLGLNNGMIYMVATKMSFHWIFMGHHMYHTITKWFCLLVRAISSIKRLTLPHTKWWEERKKNSSELSNLHRNPGVHLQFKWLLLSPQKKML